MAGSSKQSAVIRGILSPCQSLIDKIALKKDKYMIVVHTNDEGKTSITEKKIGERDTR